MLKKVNWILIFKSFAWTICLAGTIVLMSFIDGKKKNVKCTKIGIVIPGADNFVEIDEINAILKSSQGDLIGRNIEGINFNEIEKSISSNPYIGYVKVYTEMNGNVFVEIKQREPILRVINVNGLDYYVDKTGLKIPISLNFTADVLVASGNIFEGYNGKVDTLSTSLGKDLFQLAQFIKNDKFWNSQIEQIYVNQKNEIELTPRVGNQEIILGDAMDYDKKFKNLFAFYQQVLPEIGWSSYRKINLKYVNQVICEKNDSLSVKKLNILPDSLIEQRQQIDSAIIKSINEAKEDDKKNNEQIKQKPIALEKPNVDKEHKSEKKSSKEIKKSTAEETKQTKDTKIKLS